MNAFFLHTKEEMDAMQKLERMVRDASSEEMADWMSSFEVKKTVEPAATAVAEKSNPFEKPAYIGPPDLSKMRAAGKKVQPIASRQDKVLSDRPDVKQKVDEHGSDERRRGH